MTQASPTVTQSFPWTRQDVRFTSTDTHCSAWLYLPSAQSAHAKPGPAIVLGHGLGAIKEMGLQPYAEAFADAGYVVLVFDYRHFGESGGEPRQLLDIQRQLDDWAAALTYVRSLDPVDPERVAIFGSSFGGGHAIITAARDTRVAAAIAQCPFTHGIASALCLGPLGLVKVSAISALDTAAGVLKRKPKMINLAGAPHSAALMNAADVVSGYHALLPEGIHHEEKVAARVGLAISRHFPGRYARQVQCPILFAVCDQDSVAPAGPTLRYARQAPRGEVIRYPIKHFDIYLGDAFKHAIADQLAFLRKHVPVSVADTESDVG
ncbi:alpha/beta hydrolase [Ketobacter sp.]|uniref:alpha/beta hydrolase n=1 Tax=Ketobacter sp. TaxID=2083498 RepID=UPI000F1BCAEE|nr:alpha/beta hydrolase [Ketobacter sp.]RLT96850.1 MAG: alpha/beta hydrolase [Ketobacter sp.]